MSILRELKYQTLLSQDSPIPHDIKFEVENSTVAAHKLVLSLASPFFRELFYGPVAVTVEANTGMIKVPVISFTCIAIQKIVSYIYSCLDSTDYRLVEEKPEITDQEEIQMVLETSRAADYYKVLGLQILCQEAIARIRVIRTNRKWLDSFVGLGPGEEVLHQKVLQVNHEFNCRMCSAVTLRGSHVDGLYKMCGFHNDRPWYKLYKWYQPSASFYEISIYFIFYTGSDWLIGKDHKRVDTGLIRFPDTSMNCNPPVFTPSKEYRQYLPDRRDYSDQWTPDSGIILTCGAIPVCQHVSVTSQGVGQEKYPEMMGEYTATGEYFNGVMSYRNKEYYRIESGNDPKVDDNANSYCIFINCFDVRARCEDEKLNTSRLFCPCQTRNWKVSGAGIIQDKSMKIFCLDRNCSCQYHNN